MVLYAAFLWRFSKTWIESPFGRFCRMRCASRTGPWWGLSWRTKPPAKPTRIYETVAGGRLAMAPSAAMSNGLAAAQITSAATRIRHRARRGMRAPESSDDSHRCRGCGKIVHKGGRKAFASKVLRLLEPGGKSTPMCQAPGAAVPPPLRAEERTWPELVWGRVSDPVMQPERPLAFQSAKAESDHLLGSYFPPGDEGVSRKHVAERSVRGLGDADARGYTDAVRAISVFADPQAAGYGGQIAPVVEIAGDGETLRQPSRSAV